jgi:cytochrome c biogenesis protein CcmG, thiol:disulfide interchange protein DsbE
LKGRLQIAGVLLFLALLVAACGAPGATGGTQTGISEGQSAPDFSLETLDGDKVSLSDYRGQIVLINFWATWCAPCRAEIPAIEAVLEARQDEPFVVLGVNYQESRDRIRPFVDELSMTYPVLLDETGRVMQTYRAPGLPMSILLDENGVIQHRHAGLLTEAQLEGYLADLLP